MVTDMEGRPLIYGPNGREGAMGFANPWFVARGAPPTGKPD